MKLTKFERTVALIVVVSLVLSFALAITCGVKDVRGTSEDAQYATLGGGQ